MTGDRRHPPALLYLIPRYAADSPEHFFHLYGFLRKLSGRITVQVIAERVSGALPPDLQIRPLRSRNSFLRFLEELAVILAARLRGTRDVYVHYSYSGAIAAALVMRLMGGRVFYWNCGMYAGFAPPPGAPWKVRLRAARDRFLLETSVRLAHHLVTGTPRMRAYYAEHARIPESGIRLLPNYIDATRFLDIPRAATRAALGFDPSEKVILFLHRLAERKGAHRLPQIAQALLETGERCRFVVAGDGPYRAELLARVRAAGLEDRFDFRGWVANRDAPQYFRAADLFLMPSAEEGFPRVLLETMAAECPFVAFDVGGVLDILPAELRECVAPAGDMDGFIQRCLRALRDEPVRRGWIAAGRRQVEVFSEGRVLDAFLAMLGGAEPTWPDLVRPDGGRG